MASSNPSASLPRQKDQSADDHTRLLTRITQIQDLSDAALDTLRRDARQTMTGRMSQQANTMARDDRTTFAAVAQLYTKVENATPAARPSMLDGADATLSRLGRRFAESGVADDLDAGRIVQNQRRIAAREGSAQDDLVI